MHTIRLGADRRHLGHLPFPCIVGRKAECSYKNLSKFDFASCKVVLPPFLSLLFHKYNLHVFVECEQNKLCSYIRRLLTGVNQEDEQERKENEGIVWKANR
ncbi:hypothetical protein V6N13_075484 [Hibiscus sabdariffa]|uniref:Uncharacterized protein n=1 Tax=Hibiscus sabdariffa TaxID=183260 RepID=A0ABR2UBM6_9ROSI